MTTHGGARPKVRDDDARTRNGGGGRGQGRKPQSFTLKLDDKLYVARADADGNGILPSELWTITEVTRTYLRVQSSTGDSVRLVR